MPSVTLRLSREEHAMLRAAATASGMSMAAYLRETIVRISTPAAPAEELPLLTPRTPALPMSAKKAMP